MYGPIEAVRRKTAGNGAYIILSLYFAVSIGFIIYGLYSGATSLAYFKAYFAKPVTNCDLYYSLFILYLFTRK